MLCRVRATAIVKRLVPGLMAIVLAAAVLLLLDRPRRSAESETAAAGAARPFLIDLLEYVTVLDVEEAEVGIRAGLAEAGLVEGRDVELRIRNAQGDMPTLSTLVDAAISDGTDLIMTLSTPTLQAALRRAADVPVVFTFVADAVAAGAGKSAHDHLPNVTGVTTVSPYVELLSLARECLPGLRRVGTLFVPAEVNSVFNTDRLAELVRDAGIEFESVPVNSISEMSDAADALCGRGLDAILQVGSNLTSSGFASIGRAARRCRTPLFGVLSSDADNGAALVVARDFREAGRMAAGLAARVLRGEDPSRIPFASLEVTNLLVNPQAARELGLEIPASVLARARPVGGD
jgi:ABC-type uncharacterized transport system substrate-binding protein